MNLFKKLDRHADLMATMSEKVGVDLGEELVRHHLSPEHYRSAVLRCARCQSVGACLAWQKGNETAEAAPAFCENRALFAALRD